MMFGAVFADAVDHLFGLQGGRSRGIMQSQTCRFRDWASPVKAEECAIAKRKLGPPLGWSERRLICVRQVIVS